MSMTHCPKCNTELQEDEEGQLYCTTPECPVFEIEDEDEEDEEAEVD